MAAGRLARAQALAAALVSAWAAHASWGLVRVEMEHGGEAFLGVGTGVATGMIPAGFGLVALRFLAAALADRPPAAPPPGGAPG